MDEAQLKSLKVKTGTLRRLRKELGMYVEEQTKESDKVEKLRSQGADPHDIKYAENILAESSAMVPDTRQRLEQAYDQLKTFVDELEPREIPEVVAAKEELDQTADTLQTTS